MYPPYLPPTLPLQHSLDPGQVDPHVGAMGLADSVPGSAGIAEEMLALMETVECRVEVRVRYKVTEGVRESN